MVVSQIVNSTAVEGPFLRKLLGYYSQQHGPLSSTPLSYIAKFFGTSILPPAGSYRNFVLSYLVEDDATVSFSDSTGITVNLI